MINIYNWSYVIEKNLVRITFNCPLANKMIVVGKAFNATLLTNIKGNDNELYFSLKNNVIAYEFVNTLMAKYPNSFSLKNNWNISQTANFTVCFYCLIESNQNPTLIKDTVSSMFDDLKIISSITDRNICDFELNIDSSVGYMNFNIIFSTQNNARRFIKDYNQFNK